MKLRTAFAPGLLCLALLALAGGQTHAQALRTEMTWGGTGADVATAVATAADGSAYLVGSTDSFALDEFGQPATRMFCGTGAVPSPIAPARWRRTAMVPFTSRAGPPVLARAPPACSS